MNNKNIRPEIAKTNIKIEGYDIVFISYFAPIIYRKNAKTGCFCLGDNASTNIATVNTSLTQTRVNRILSLTI